MQKKADAFAQYGDAAVLQMLVEVLPQVVAKASEPLSAIDKMTVISTDGASQLSRTVADNVAQGMELLSSTTGVDLARAAEGHHPAARRTGRPRSGAGPWQGRDHRLKPRASGPALRPRTTAVTDRTGPGPGA